MFKRALSSRPTDAWQKDLLHTHDSKLWSRTPTIIKESGNEKPLWSWEHSGVPNLRTLVITPQFVPCIARPRQVLCRARHMNRSKVGIAHMRQYDVVRVPDERCNPSPSKIVWFLHQWFEFLWEEPFTTFLHVRWSSVFAHAERHRLAKRWSHSHKPVFSLSNCKKQEVAWCFSRWCLHPRRAHLTTFLECGWTRKYEAEHTQCPECSVWCCVLNNIAHFRF